MNVGDSVRYHPIIGRADDGRTYEVRALGEISDGRPVAWLVGKAGCVALNALSKAAPDSEEEKG